MILPIIDGWRLFAVQQLGLVIRMFSILMTAGTLFFLWGPVTHKTQYLQSVCWHIRASTRRLLPLLLTWYASPLNKHNARGRGTEPKQKRTLRGKGWKIQRNFMYFNYIQEPCVLKCSYVGRCFGENVFWTHYLRRLHGVSIGRNPYPCLWLMAWISFVFECNQKVH